MRARRRAALAALLAALLPGGARAQSAREPAREPRRVAILFSGGRENYYDDFTAELHRRGYADEKNLKLFPRWAQGDIRRLPGLAEEILAWNPEVVVTSSTAATNAMRRTGTRLPIVMATSADPVRSGFVESLERPGGNITGNSSLPVELNVKTVAMLREVLPAAKRLGLLLTATSAYGVQVPDLERAAAALGVELVVLRASTEAELDALLPGLKRDGLEGLVVLGDAVFVVLRRKLAALCAKHSMPAVYQWKSHVEAGGLMSYGPQIFHAWKMAARYVDRILKGADPATLPVDQTRIFELAVNTNAARALGIRIPKAILARADVLIG